jgi:acetyltransferase-like isoleucine patch superfamily enzyme
VSIGRGSIVAANACVVRDVPDYVIAGGVPAKVVGENRDGEAEFMDRAEMLERQRERAGT